MKLCRYMLLAAVFLWMAGNAAQAEEMTAAKRVNVERLIDMTGSLELGRQFANLLIPQMMAMIKKAHPELSPEELAIIPEEIDGTIKNNMAGLKVMLVELYGKYYSNQEVEQLIDFYATPVGQKSIKVAPSLMRDSTIIGQQWGRALAPQFQQRIRDRFKSKGIVL